MSVSTLKGHQSLMYLLGGYRPAFLQSKLAKISEILKFFQILRQKFYCKNWKTGLTPIFQLLIWDFSQIGRLKASNHVWIQLPSYMMQSCPPTFSCCSLQSVLLGTDQGQTLWFSHNWQSVRIWFYAKCFYWKIWWKRLVWVQYPIFTKIDFSEHLPFLNEDFFIVWGSLQQLLIAYFKWKSDNFLYYPIFPLISKLKKLSSVNLRF